MNPNHKKLARTHSPSQSRLFESRWKADTLRVPRATRFCAALALLTLCHALVASRTIAEENNAQDAAIPPSAELRILPEQFTLHGIESRQQLSVVWFVEDRIGGLVESDQLEIESSGTEVARVEDGVVKPVGNGRATIVARFRDGREAQAQVEVVDADREHRWSFRNDLESVFSKIGCNSGACHGALAGKGGFRLSLRGYNPERDYLTITREARGRRVELADPGKSLVLTKPSGALPHKGGLKLDPQSDDYRILSQWIAAGAEGPKRDDPKLVGISVTPEASLLRVGDRSRILVTAHYDDGRAVDVTHWAQFTATDESIAGVDSTGMVEVRGSGEGAVLVWFGSKVALARMTVPYPNQVDGEVFAAAAKRNFIDEANLKQLQTLQLPPSPRCDDQAFVRRASLDTIGRLPTDEEREQFLSEPEATRRDSLIERLLASEDFVDYWTYRWCDMLLINGTRLRPVAVRTYYDWVHKAVAENRPWDQLVREILTATGGSDENGATNFYALHQSPEDMTENACQAFLGLSIGCARCHNHPLEKWTNDQYYSMANLFARVRAKGWGGDGRNGDGIRTVYVASTGELIQPGIGRPQPPAPLDAEPVEFDDPRDRREVLAQWMTDPENPYFSRAITNRVWANFFGRGLVEQVDDLRLSNPASNEPLLVAAAQHVVDAKFDLKQLMRAILRSETYQRSSVALSENQSENRYLSRYYPRRLMAEVLLDSIDQVLGTATKFDQIAFPGADMQKTDFYKEGTRAIELYDSAVNSYFLKTFGRNPREITCECERSDDPSMVQVLHLSNGDTLNPKLESESNILSTMTKEGREDRAILSKVFVRALSREPSEKELEAMLSVIKEYGDDRATALQDAAWSILTSTEFTFNH